MYTLSMNTTCLTIGSVRQRMTNDKYTILAACSVEGCSRQPVALLLLSSSLGFGTERHRLIEENRQKDYITRFEERSMVHLAANSHQPLNFLIGTPLQQHIIIFFHKGYAAVNFTLACMFRIWIALHYRLVNAHGCLRNGRVNQCSQRDIHAMYMYDAMKYLGGQQGHLYIICRLLKC